MKKIYPFDMLTSQKNQLESEFELKQENLARILKRLRNFHIVDFRPFFGRVSA